MDAVGAMLLIKTFRNDTEYTPYIHNIYTIYSVLFQTFAKIEKPNKYITNEGKEF